MNYYVYCVVGYNIPKEILTSLWLIYLVCTGKKVTFNYPNPNAY